MPRDDVKGAPLGALRPDEVAAEAAAELPDREAMSLITGPGGAGPLPFLGHPIQPTPPDTVVDPVTPEQVPVAQDTGAIA